MWHCTRKSLFPVIKGSTALHSCTHVLILTVLVNRTPSSDGQYFQENSSQRERHLGARYSCASLYYVKGLYPQRLIKRDDGICNTVLLSMLRKEHDGRPALVSSLVDKLHHSNPGRAWVAQQRRRLPQDAKIGSGVFCSCKNQVFIFDL